MKLIKRTCEQCRYKRATIPCVDCSSRDRWELAETITVNSKDIEALQQEIEQYNTLLNQIHGNLCSINKEMDKTMVLPENYHNPADVEVLKQAREVLTAIRLDDWPGISEVQRALDLIDEVIADDGKQIGGGQDAKG